jgi:hypothetical protein
MIGFDHDVVDLGGRRPPLMARAKPLAPRRPMRSRLVPREGRLRSPPQIAPATIRRLGTALSLCAALMGRSPWTSTSQASTPLPYDGDAYHVALLTVHGSYFPQRCRPAGDEDCPLSPGT